MLLLLAVAGCSPFSRREAYEVGAVRGAELGRVQALFRCGQADRDFYESETARAATAEREYAAQADAYRQGFQEWLDQGRHSGELGWCRRYNWSEADRAWDADFSRRLDPIRESVDLRERARIEAADPANQARAAAARAQEQTEFQRSMDDLARRHEAERREELEKRVRRLEEEKRRREQQERQRQAGRP